MHPRPRHLARFLAPTLSLLLPAVISTAMAADWPQWGGSARRNMASAEKGLPDSFDAGKVHCLDIKTGEHLWVHDTSEEIWSSTFVADGKVYVGTRKSLTILAAGPDLQHLADIKLATPIWAVPSAANGVLYVSSQKNLWAIRKGAEVAVPGDRTSGK